MGEIGGRDESPRALPLLRVEGSHHKVGLEVGSACASVVQHAVELESAGRPSRGRTMAEVMDVARRSREITADSIPWLLEELDGVAEGAGVDPLCLFAASMEELWETRPSQPGGSDGRCTDALVTPARTKSGHLLVAHNNDLGAESEKDLVAIEWAVHGEPVIFTIGVGPWISVGWSAAGISLTGNEVSPNDERPGVPRLLLVRAQLRAKDLDEAVAVTLHPARASAYNTLFGDRHGRAVNVEASATAACTSEPDGSGALVHTNHYVSPAMKRYEDDPNYARRSARRYERARQLLGEMGGSLERGDLRVLLSDHENGEDAICRHGREGRRIKTVFWCVADVTAGIVTYGAGNPCQDTPGETYRFDYGR